MARNFFNHTTKLKNKAVTEDLKDWKYLNLTPEFHAKHVKQWQAFYEQGNYWGKRLARQFIQAQTIAYIKKNKPKDLDSLVAQRITEPKTTPSGRAKIKKATKNQVQISVKPIDCLDAARKLVRKGKRVAVLNMANQFERGGAYAHGAGAQEEDLFRRTNIIQSLDKHFYKKRTGFGEFNTLYSDTVKVLRKGVQDNYKFYPKNKQFEISVISSAAYNLKFSLFSTSNKQYKEGTRRKIVMQLETAIREKHKNLVLSAFGCGAFRNDPKTVAELYHEVLNLPRYKHAFDTVTFAIVPNPGAKDKNYEIFKEVFTRKKPQQRLKQFSDNSFFKRGLMAVAGSQAAILVIMALNFLSVLSIPLTFNVLMVSGLIGAALFSLPFAYFQNNQAVQNRKIRLRDGIDEAGVHDELVQSSGNFLPTFSHRIKKDIELVNENVVPLRQGMKELSVPGKVRQKCGTR